MGSKRLAAVVTGALAAILAAGLVVRRRVGGSGLDSATREELYKRAQRLNIRGRSKMNKQQLQTAVERESD